MIRERLSKFNLDNREVNKNTLLDEHNQQMIDAYDIDSQDIFNLNNGYLLLILRVMDNYMLLNLQGVEGAGKQCPDYFEAQTRNLEQFITLLSAKLIKSKREKQLKKLDNIIDKIKLLSVQVFMKNNFGEDVFNPVVAEIIEKWYKKIYRYLQLYMEERGMLTKLPENPFLAGSRFKE